MTKSKEIESSSINKRKEPTEKKTFGAQHNGHYSVSTSNNSRNCFCANEHDIESSINPSLNEPPPSCPCVDYPPQPQPPCSKSSKDLWDLQFCRWWGWNWIKKRDELMNQKQAERKNIESNEIPKVKKRTSFNTWLKKNFQTRLNDCEKQQLQDLYDTPCSSITFNTCPGGCRENNLESKSLYNPSYTNTTRQSSKSAVCCCKCNVKTESLICAKSQSNFNECSVSSTSEKSIKEYFSLRLKCAKSEVSPKRTTCICQNRSEKPKITCPPPAFQHRSNCVQEPCRYPILCKRPTVCQPPCCHPRICKPKPPPSLYLRHSQPNCILRVPKDVNYICDEPPKREMKHKSDKGVCRCPKYKEIVICGPREKKNKAEKNICCCCQSSTEKEYELCLCERKKKTQKDNPGCRCCCCKKNDVKQTHDKNDVKQTLDKNEGTSSTLLQGKSCKCAHLKKNDDDDTRPSSSNKNQSQEPSSSNKNQSQEKLKPSKSVHSKTENSKASSNSKASNNSKPKKSPVGGKKYAVNHVKTSAKPIVKKSNFPSPIDPGRYDFAGCSKSLLDDEHNKLLCAISEAMISAHSPGQLRTCYTTRSNTCCSNNFYNPQPNNAQNQCPNFNCCRRIGDLGQCNWYHTFNLESFRNTRDFSMLAPLLEERNEEADNLCTSKSNTSMGTFKIDPWEALSLSSQKTTLSSNSKSSKRKSELLSPFDFVRSPKVPKIYWSGLLDTVQEYSIGSPSKPEIKVETLGKTGSKKASKIPILNKKRIWCRSKLQVDNLIPNNKFANCDPIPKENFQSYDQYCDTSSLYSSVTGHQNFKPALASTSNSSKSQQASFKLKYAEIRSRDRNNFESGIRKKMRKSALPTLCVNSKLKCNEKKLLLGSKIPNKQLM